ncbi:MAG: FCD domain-containing protein [Anaerolineae bacterium]|jgi:DNA-binding FadR family transcriptional regulator|nr:FCD domain-containing protein [Anaerolineae bacterium]MBT7073657.1 FCD domain-containing protein [Anaerolineae bacterium]
MINKLSDFLKYLAARKKSDKEGIPALDQLSAELDINRAALREQVAVARALGLVSVKPRVGIQRLAYSFTPALQQSLGYAILRDRANFEKYSDLRTHVESAYFHQAVEKLEPVDIEELKELIEEAWGKLRGTPTKIPHQEHRDLHIVMYKRLDNIFITGILEAYWEAYEAVELNVFTDYNYLTEVWDYHTRIVEAIERKKYDEAHQILLNHTKLIAARPH